MGDPKTKELFKVGAKGAGESMPERGDGARTLRQMPPAIQKTASAHAGRGVVEETPITLDPAVAVRIGARRDSEEIPVITANVDPVMMETSELRDFVRSAECVDKEDFGPEQFANRITFSQQKSEGERGARYVFIRTDDGSTWRLYPHMEGLASMEKFEKCRFAATLRADGKDYQLYREAPGIAQK